MDATSTDSTLAEACKRLFDLHESGYKRPRPSTKRSSTVPPNARNERARVRHTVGHWVI